MTAEPQESRQGANWISKCGRNPGSRRVQDDDEPVVQVCWEDANAFCKWLTEAAEAQVSFRLTTEVEWGVYAPCRAGSQTTWSFGDKPDGLCEFAWYEHNSDR